jgi:cytochrome c-type biogenesis protein CcmH/NrfG
VATNPNYAEAEGYLGLTLNELGRPGEALAHLERAVSLKPGHPELIGNLGVVLAALNRPEAEERFRQALAVQPNHGMALRNLGRLLAKLERHEEAVSWLERAVAVGPADARTLTGLGQALIELNRLDQAKAAYEKATAADPLYGGGWLGLGRVCRILGRFDEALGHALHWLALDPGSQEALTAVAESSRESLTPDAAMRLEQVLAGPGPSAAKRPPLHTALSRHYEASLAYDDAFRHMTAMNAIHSRELIETGARYDAEGQRRRGDRMISVCTPDLFRRLRDIGDPSPLPVFVVGLPRSGTTLCEQILSSHSQVHGAGELKAVRELARGLGDRLVAAGIVAGDYPEALADLSPAVARQAALEHLAFLRSLGPKATRVVDKMPFNFMNLGLIAVLFPNAKILHCRRNPADTALSCFQQNFAADMPWTVDLASLGHYYREYDRLMRHWKNVLPIPILDVVYEEEVADLETWARRLIAFCGLEWEDACLRFFETERAVKTASDWQVRQPLYATSVGRWRNYQRHLGPLFEALGDLHRE